MKSMNPSDSCHQFEVVHRSFWTEGLSGVKLLVENFSWTQVFHEKIENSCLKQCSQSISMYFGGCQIIWQQMYLGIHDQQWRLVDDAPASVSVKCRKSSPVQVNLHRWALLIYGNNQSDTSDCLVLKRFLFQQNFQLKNHWTLTNQIDANLLRLDITLPTKRAEG